MIFPFFDAKTYIAVGSSNSAKIGAVKNSYAKFYGLEQKNILPDLHSYQTESGVSKQPIGYEEIIRGAKNRAEHAYALAQQAGLNPSHAIGQECGVVSIPGENQAKWYNLSVASLLIDSKFYLGLSSLFPIPVSLIEPLKQGRDLVEACLQLGLTKDEKMGSKAGLAPLLTYQQMERIDYLEMAVYHSLIDYDGSSSCSAPPN